MLSRIIQLTVCTLLWNSVHSLDSISVVADEDHGSSLAIRIAEPDLIPEGIAYDPDTGVFYLGSFRKSKIIVANEEGGFRDFIAEHQDGFMAGIGMDVDERRKVLWVNTGTAPHMRDYSRETLKVTGIFKYDLTTGKLLCKSLIPQNDIFHIFNDMAVNPEGDVYVTTFSGDLIYLVEGESCELSEFIELPDDFWPNGIDITPGGEILFVSGRTGVCVVNCGSRTFHMIQIPPGESLVGIDGLYYYKGSLIAVQSKRGYGEDGSRIARIFLDEAFSRVERIEVLDEDHELYSQPTTGVIVGEWFYYIANSQFPKFNDAFELAPAEDLSDIYILKVKLE